MYGPAWSGDTVGIFHCRSELRAAAAGRAQFARSSDFCGGSNGVDLRIPLAAVGSPATSPTPRPTTSTRVPSIGTHSCPSASLCQSRHHSFPIADLNTSESMGGELTALLQVSPTLSTTTVLNLLSGNHSLLRTNFHFLCQLLYQRSSIFIPPAS